MDNENLRRLHASAMAAVTSIFVTTAVTIIAELYTPFKDWLKGLTGHHWITKSWLSLLVFVLAFSIIYTLIKKPEAHRVKRSLELLLASMLSGTILLLGFFVLEFYGT